MSPYLSLTSGFSFAIFGNVYFYFYLFLGMLRKPLAGGIMNHVVLIGIKYVNKSLCFAFLHLSEGQYAMPENLTAALCADKLSFSFTYTPIEIDCHP